MEFRMVGQHPEDLADGRQVANGDFVDLSAEDLREDRNEDLLAAGKLIPVDKKAEREADLAVRRAGTREDRAEAESAEAEARVVELATGQAQTGEEE